MSKQDDPRGLKDHIIEEYDIETRLEMLITNNLKSMSGRDKRSANESKALGEVWNELLKKPSQHKRMWDFFRYVSDNTRKTKIMGRSDYTVSVRKIVDLFATMDYFSAKFTVDDLIENVEKMHNPGSVVFEARLNQRTASKRNLHSPRHLAMTKKKLSTFHYVVAENKTFAEVVDMKEQMRVQREEADKKKQEEEGDDVRASTSTDRFHTQEDEVDLLTDTQTDKLSGLLQYPLTF